MDLLTVQEAGRLPALRFGRQFRVRADAIELPRPRRPRLAVAGV